MTATETTPTTRAEHPGSHRLLRTGALAGAIAAVASTVAAAVARAVDVGLEVDGVPIPLAAFAWWTLVGAGLGIVLAGVIGDPRRFVLVTAAATAASLVPAVAAPDDIASKAILVACHLLAAAIVIPALARRLEQGP